MIPSTELRIGSKVLFAPQGRRHHTIKPRVCTVRELGEAKCVVEDKGLPLSLDYKTEDIQPIPLSGEVLLACGFQERNDTIYINVCTGLSLEFDEDNHIIIVHWDEIVFDLNEQVKSLHQLQNLYFALTSKELIYQPK